MTAPHPDRRTVLKRLGAAGLVLGGAGALGAFGLLGRSRFGRVPPPRTIPDHRVPDDARYPALAVARGTDAALLVRAALDRIGGIARFVRPGETVLLKPNAAWDRTPEQGANTHPAIVAELVRQCRAARAARVIVAEVPVHDASRALERSGIRRAALEGGAELVVPPNAAFSAALLKGAVLEEWDVLDVVFAADRVINVPVVKDHALSRFTCGFKNWYGLLGGTRARLHQDIHPSIADLAAAVLPTLTVVDATRIMMRGGPTGGRLDDIVAGNAVAAGTDPVALDAWAARQMDLDVSLVTHIALAEHKGLGRSALGTGAVEEIHVGA